MAFYADLHVHSRHSRATSRESDLEHLARWARYKGLSVVATGDFTHPAWFDEIRNKLVPAEPGLFRLRAELERQLLEELPGACRGPVRFMLEVEISTIYKKGERTRKVHHLVYAASLDTAGQLRRRLERIGNLASDGRPILGLDSRHLLEIVLESGDDAYLVPAHAWTPWFAVLGSKSGFDSVEECYGDLSDRIFALETGLSSDPPMNWRVSALDRFTLVSNSDAHSPPVLGREACVFDTDLDYFAIRRALETGQGYLGTLEFFPEEGKYHLDGHRVCGVRLAPDETRAHGGRCPACGKPVTVGVMHRVETLADRPAGARPDEAAPFRRLVPLAEVLAEIRGVGPRTKTVRRSLARVVERFGPEIDILERLAPEEATRAGEPLLAEALARLRAGRVRSEPGYDGQYGTIRLFTPEELSPPTLIAPLFDGTTRAAETAERERRPAGAAGAPSGEPGFVLEPEGAGPRMAQPRPSTPPTDQPAASPILQGLDPEQRAAARVVHGPLLIIAGPGTGKTRTLTHRLAYLVAEAGVPPERCLALTFTRRAAAEMRARLAQLLAGTAERILVTTFHGLGLTILRQHAGELGLGEDFRIADSRESAAIVAELFTANAVGAAAARRRARVTELLEEIREERRRAVGTHSGASPAPFGPRSVAYEEALRHRGLVDFDDLILLPLRLLDRRSDLVADYRDRYRWISIDEYQDIDHPQYRLVRRLAPPEGHLCAIGDPDQSIYGFRGADVELFLRFRGDYPGARVVHLRRNYRSSPAIVDAAAQAIAPAALVAERQTHAVRRQGARHIVLHEARSDRAEAEFVARSIERLLGGTSYFSVDSGRAGGEAVGELSFDDFAVLYRTHAQARPFAEALERAGIPFQERSHQRLVEVEGVPALIRWLHRQGRGAGPVRRLLVRAATELEAGDQPEIARAAELLRPIAERSGEDLAGFLAEVALGAEVDTWDPRAERVTLLTLHAAKGLEFRVVFLAGCEDGLLPLRAPGDEPIDRDLGEERRLFFVGLTRARDRLVLSWSRRRVVYGTAEARSPSPFLREIDEALLARERTRRRERAPDRTAVEQLRLLLINK